MKTDLIPVYETFSSWQGEGVHLGRSAFFIRTFGCPVHCPWCDSAGTWHPEYMPKGVSRHAVSDLVSEVTEAMPEFVVITGGEPAIHDLSMLTDALSRKGFPVHLETSGAFPLRGQFDWITLSPKKWKMPLDENLGRADEIKLIVESVEDIDFYWNAIGGNIRSDSVWLHPEWGHCGDRGILDAITETVKQRGRPFRAGWQLHKNYRADFLDQRHRPETYLGGQLSDSVCANSSP